MLFDLESGFDTVPRENITENLETYGVDGSLIEGMRSLYKGSANMVRTVNEESYNFITYRGVRHGGVLSHLLFIIYINESIKESNRITTTIDVRYNRLFMQREDK